MLFIVGAEGEFNLSFIEQLEKEAGGEVHTFAHVFLRQFQNVLIFVADGEAACGTGGKGYPTRFFRLADGINIDFSMLFGLVVEPVGYLCHTAAFFFVEQLHAIAHSIHDFHQILTELGVIVVHVAAVEIAHLL